MPKDKPLKISGFSARVDYLSFTVPISQGGIEQDLIARRPADYLAFALGPYMASTGHEFHEIRPVESYTHGISSSANGGGVCAYMNVKAQQNKLLIVASGRPLGRNEVSLKRVKTGNGLKVTRFDVAIDLMGHSTNVSELIKDFVYNLIDESRVWSTATKGNGNTLYIGSWDSSQMLRVYDKDKERGTVGDAIRYEIVLRDEYANQLWDLAKHNPLTVIGNFFKVMRDENLLAYRLLKVVGQTKAMPVKRDREQGATERWLKETVGASLKKLRDRDREGYDAVIDFWRKNGII
jgi:Replication initiation factor